MSPPLTAREDILARIRAALPDLKVPVEASHASITRSYCHFSGLDRAGCLQLFIDKLIDYDTEVIELTDETELPAGIKQALQDAGEDRLLVPSGPLRTLVAEDVDVCVDHGLTTPELDCAQAVLTRCEAAVASTGTIFLVHGGDQGRRALTLLPDHHICIVRRDQVYGSIPEALTAIGSQSARPITSISGPSATSDIEMVRIRGVHGPRRLTVLLHGDL
jgi:L-lactate dehydrogenase complex protein LldG